MRLSVLRNLGRSHGITMPSATHRGTHSTHDIRTISSIEDHANGSKQSPIGFVADRGQRRPLRVLTIVSVHAIIMEFNESGRDPAAITLELRHCVITHS